jgi:acetyl esterase/lipase
MAGQMEPVLIADRIGIPVLSVDYRMPPAHPFPAALEDAVAAWRGVLERHAPGSVVLGGTSAGGGLALALVHRLKALKLPLPGALYLGTPWSDLTKTGDSYWINEGADRLLVTYDGALAAAARLYAAGRDLRDPLISPVYGDFGGFPPAFLVTGSRDLFLSLTARVHRRLREAGVQADLNVYEGLSHGDHIGLMDTPESRQVYRELGAFISRHLEPGG